MAYDSNVFLNNTLIRQDLPRLRANANAIANAFTSDHAPLTTEGDTVGNHTTIKFINRTEHPTDSKDSFYVLNDNGVKRLYARFGSISGSNPIEIVGSGQRRDSGVQTANNPGSLAGSISYIDTLDGTRKYWGETTAGIVALRTVGLTVVLPTAYTNLITSYGYFTSSREVSITGGSNSTFSGVIVESTNNTTFTFLSHISERSNLNVGFRWYIEVINASS